MTADSQSTDSGVPDQGLYSAQPVFTVEGAKLRREELIDAHR